MKAISRIFLTAILAGFVLAAPLFCADWTTLINQVEPSVARITTIVDGQSQTICTTFSINDAKDYFLTANHCDDTQNNDDHTIWVEGHVGIPIYTDPNADLLVLVVPDSGNVPALKLADTSAVGESVGMYGWGYGLDLPDFRVSHISLPLTALPQSLTGAYGTPAETYTLLDSNFVHGMSGGPVFNTQGEVVTIVQGNTPDNLGAGRSLSELRARVGRYWEP